MEAAKLSEDWIKEKQERVLAPKAHYTRQIEGTHLNQAIS